MISYLLLPILLAPQSDSTHEVRELIEKLRSDKVEVREGAATKLKELGKTARPELEKAANDADPEVSARARQLLHRLAIIDHLPESVRNKLPGIEDKMAKGDKRSWTLAFIEASEVQGDFHSPKPLHGAIRKRDLEFLAASALAGAESGEHFKVCSAVGFWSLESGASGLVSLLKHPNPESRKSGAHALRMLRCKEAIPGLISCLADTDPSVGCEAALALGEMGVRESIPGAVKLLGQIDGDRRTPLLVSLAQLGASEAVSEGMKLLEEGDGGRGIVGAYVLALSRNKEAVPALISLLGHKDLEVQIAASIGLAELHAREAIPAFVGRLKEPSPRVRGNAAWALGLLDAKEAIPDLLKCLEGDRQARDGAAEALALLQGKDAAPALLKVLENGSATSDWKIYDLLGRLGSEEAIPIARRQVGGNDPAHAAEYLCRVGDRAGVPAHLRRDGSRFVLNAIRQPEAWKLLREKVIVKNLFGTPRHIVEQALKNTGLKVEWPDSTSGEEDLWNAIWTMEPSNDRRPPLPSLYFLERAAGRYEVILEKDAAKVVPRAQAVKFWDAWWKSEEGRK